MEEQQPSPTTPQQPVQEPPKFPVTPTSNESPVINGDKSFLAAWLLSYFLGFLGADRFYLGYTGLGVLKLLTLGGCGIWALVDWILIWAGVLKAKDGSELQDRQKNLKTVLIVFLVSLVIYGLVNILSAVSNSSF